MIVGETSRLALLHKVDTGHVAVGPDQIGLVAADNRTRANHRFKFREIWASSYLGFALHLQPERLVIGSNPPAVVVEQSESSAGFKNQLDKLAPVARRMP